jgi:para-nitrobenzyl esterase
MLAERGLGGLRGGGLAFQPVVGGAALPRSPLDAVRSGEAAAVRVVVGTTTEEWKLFGLMARGGDALDEERLVARCRAAVGDERGTALAHAYLQNRPGASVDDVWSALVTDAVFRIPAIRLAEAQAAHRHDVFVYEFGHRSTAWGGALGACHAIDIPFVFDNLHQRGIDLLVGEVGDAERALAAETAAAWLAFAHGREPWDRYDLDRRATRRFGGDSPGTHEDPAGGERLLWDGLR